MCPDVFVTLMSVNFTSSKPHPAFTAKGTWSVSPVVVLTANPHLVPRLKKEYSCTSALHLDLNPWDTNVIYIWSTYS